MCVHILGTGHVMKHNVSESERQGPAIHREVGRHVFSLDTKRKRQPSFTQYVTEKAASAVAASHHRCLLIRPPVICLRFPVATSLMDILCQDDWDFFYLSPKDLAHCKNDSFTDLFYCFHSLSLSWWNYSTEMTLCYGYTLCLFCYWIEWILSVVVIMCVNTAGKHAKEQQQQWMRVFSTGAEVKIKNSSEQRWERSNRDLIWSWNNQEEPGHAVLYQVYPKPRVCYDIQGQFGIVLFVLLKPHLSQENRRVRYRFNFRNTHPDRLVKLVKTHQTRTQMLHSLKLK